MVFEPVPISVDVVLVAFVLFRFMASIAAFISVIMSGSAPSVASACATNNASASPRVGAGVGSAVMAGI
jgi:hypothetical protein